MKNIENLSKTGKIAFYLGVIERRGNKVRYRWWNPLSYFMFILFTLIAIVGSIYITILEVLKVVFVKENPFKWK